MKMRAPLMGLWALALLALPACSSVKGAFNADPPRVTPFLAHGDEMRRDPSLPFQLTWLSPSSSQIRGLSQHYKAVVVAPVNTTYLGQGEPASWKHSFTDAAKPAEAAQLAQQMREKLIREMRELELEVLENPAPGALLIEPALVELRPTQALLNASQTAIGFFLPGSQIVTAAASAGAGAVTGAVSKGSVGMEMRLHGSNEVLAEFADRRQDPATILPNINSYSRYGYARDTIANWAREMREMFATSAGTTLEPPPAFTLALW